MQHYRSFRRNSTWQLASRLSHGTVSEHFRPWLLDASSLTQRVISVCRGAFRVQVLGQEWMRPLAEEQRRLGLRQGALALVRQVHLLCNEQPWVYARTVLPRTTLTGRNRRLARLGSRPLGAALFADPTLERDEVEIVQLAPGQTLFDMATLSLAPVPPQIWGRRSVFRVSGKPLLVSEFFLPGIPAAP